MRQAPPGRRERGSTVAVVAIAIAVVAAALLGHRSRRGPASRPAPPRASVLEPRELATSPRVPGASVLLLSVDALRPDALGVYGARDGSTPNLDAWARRSVVFERAYCQAPHTSFSIASLLLGTSLYPSGSEVLPGRSPRTIARAVRRYGIKTAAFFPPSVFTIDGERLARYEADRFGFEYVKLEHLDASRRVDQILAFLAEHRDRQVFVWAHLFDAHEPYEPPPELARGPRAFDRYRGEVALVDREVGRLLAGFRREKPESIVVLTADHGEEFGECGSYYHGNALSEPQVRVPLVIEVPGLAPRRVGGQAQVVDVPVTLLSLLDLPAPASMQGTDLGPWLAGARRGEELPPAFAELDRKKMVVRGRHKLVCDVTRDACELLDLAAAPCGEEVRAPAGGPAAERLRRELGGWVASRIPAWRAAGPWSSCLRALARGRQLDVAVIPELLERCRPWPETRREAAEVLASLRSPRALPELRRAMADRDRVTAANAVAGAALLGDEGGLRRAAELLGGGELPPRPRRRLLLARTLAGERDAGLALARELPGLRDPYEEVEAIQALGALGDIAAAPAIRDKLAAWRTRLVAIEALGRLRDPASIPALAASLRDDRFTSWRRSAAVALAQIGGPAAREALVRAARHEVEVEVASVARAQLARLPKGAPPTLAR